MLNRALHQLVLSGRIKGIRGPRNVVPPSHVFYADDLIIFCNAAASNVKKIMRLLLLLLFFNQKGQ